MSSTTTAGGIAAPVGNTMYGEMPRSAPRPEDVAPYRSERYVPPTQVTVLPRLIGGPPRIPREEYPPEALKLGIERRVIAIVTVDETGKVAQVRVLDDPGYGFREAAERIVRKYYRFEPARRGEESVATTLRIPVAFEISGG
jgi:protein TonB